MACILARSSHVAEPYLILCACSSRTSMGHAEYMVSRGVSMACSPALQKVACGACAERQPATQPSAKVRTYVIWGRARESTIMARTTELAKTRVVHPPPLSLPEAPGARRGEPVVVPSAGTDS